MWDEIEQFCEAHQHTIAALGAVSTPAVLVSLALALLAHRASRTHIKAHASISVILHPTLEGKPKPEYLTVAIINVGSLPAMIPFGFFQWVVPFRGGRWMINPWDASRHDPWIPQRNYPVEIRPRGSATIFLSDMATFRTNMIEMLHEVHRLSWRVRFIRAIVATDDARIFKVKLDQKLRHELLKLSRRARALDRL